MDLNTTHNFLETHTHSEFWSPEAKISPTWAWCTCSSPTLPPIAARPHCPRTLHGARSGAAAAALLARSGAAAAALSHSLLARTLPAARPQRLLPLPGFLPHLHRAGSFPPSAQPSLCLRPRPSPAVAAAVQAEHQPALATARSARALSLDFGGAGGSDAGERIRGPSSRTPA